MQKVIAVTLQMLIVCLLGVIGGAWLACEHDAVAVWQDLTLTVLSGMPLAARVPS